MIVKLWRWDHYWPNAKIVVILPSSPTDRIRVITQRKPSVEWAKVKRRWLLFQCKWNKGHETIPKGKKNCPYVTKQITWSFLPSKHWPRISPSVMPRDCVYTRNSETRAVLPTGSGLFVFLKNGSTRTRGLPTTLSLQVERPSSGQAHSGLPTSLSPQVERPTLGNDPQWVHTYRFIPLFRSTNPWNDSRTQQKQQIFTS